MCLMSGGCPVFGINMNRTNELKALLMAKKPQLQIKPADLLSTGSTLLNLACSGRWEGGFAKGEYIFLVGDSMSGKTWLSCTCLAEAARRKSFKNYRFIHDNPEEGAKMDMAFYFGERMAKRLEEPPHGTSRTVQEFYYNADSALDEGPCIYVLDSMDSLDDDSDVDQFEKMKAAHQDGKDTTGSYGTGKAKMNSQGLRRLTGRLQETGSILIVISQTRDNIGFGAQFNPKTRSGGKALRFYAQLEVWTSVVKTITKTVKGKKRQVGTVTQCKIKKNRHNGQLHTVDIPLYHSYGIDDMGSCIAYLCDEGPFKKRKSTIVADDLDFEGTEAKLIEHIEAEGLEPVVRELCGDTWEGIQDECRVKNRRPRYE